LSSTSFTTPTFDTYSTYFDNPEPSSFVLLGTALLVLAYFTRRRRSLP
jgi:hypothetical protein